MVRRTLLACALLLLLAVPATAAADAPVGTTFPPGFPQLRDAALGTPLIGFGAAGRVERTPVVFVHGNNDTPYPTSCNSQYGHMQRFAQVFHDQGYARSELWAIGWQGEQCDLQTNPPARSGEAHTVAANVADLRAFVRAVLDYTGARRVDVVAHSLGSTLVREWLRQDDAYRLVRRVVSVDGTNHGIINCSPSPQNYYAAPALGGFEPDSALCREVGSVRTPLLARLNAGDETPGPTTWTTVVNMDASFVYISAQDGPFPPVPPEDRDGRPQDFSRSAWLDGAHNVGLTGQARYAATGTGTAHIGINTSPETWAIALRALTAPEPPAPAPATAASPLVTAARARLTFRLRRLRTGRRAVRFRLTGRIAGGPCSGSVRVRLRARRRTVAVRRLAVRRDCTLTTTLTVRRGGGRLAVSGTPG